MNINSRNDVKIQSNVVKTDNQNAFERDNNTIPTLQEPSIITENYQNIEGGTLGNKTTDNRNIQDMDQIPTTKQMFQTIEANKIRIESPI